MNISFFGASVTKQKDGYVKIFKDLCLCTNKTITPLGESVSNCEIKIHNDVILSDYNIFQNGYGAMHIIDAGVCFIDDVLKDNPSYCFLDWFSTGYIIQSNKDFMFLDCIIRKLMLKNCKIIFLFFDRIPFTSERLQMYKLLIEYANKYNIFYIELYNNDNIVELLRDEVHTNEKGSYFYGKQIYDYFMNNILNNKITRYIDIPDENMYFTIKKMDINKIIKKNIIIKGNFLLIGIYQEIGNFSGICEIENNYYKFIYNLWDKHCYYNRITFKLSSSKYIEYFKITVLQDIFDTSLCNKSTIDFNKVEKYISIHSIFYLGNIEEINVLDDYYPLLEKNK